MSEKETSPSDPTPAKRLQTELARLRPGPSEVVETTAALVERELASVRSADAFAAAAQALAPGVIDGAKEAGAPLWHASSGAVLGALRAARGAGAAPEELVGALTDALVRRADATGADFGAAAKGAVLGALQGADELGIDEPALGSAAARAALAAAVDLGEGAVARVRRVVTGSVAGYPIRV